MENAKGAATGATHDIYFVLAEQMGLVKIGYARSARDRLRVMQTNSPDRLRLLGTVWTDAPAALELSLHSRFRHLRVHGEWFRAEPALLDHVTALCAEGEADRMRIMRAAIEEG